MWKANYIVAFALVSTVALAANTTIVFGSVPACARNCLANATAIATTCQSTDVACLCNNSTYVSSLSCCLYDTCTTAEQATAILYNQQQCSAVGSSAPNFVGCSPFAFNSSVSTSSTVPPATTSELTITTIETLPASYSNTKRITASFEGQPLYTGSCTVPFFALAGTSDTMTLFPEVGCADDRKDCCAVDIDENAGITKCPQDYFTTAGGCCPLGFQVYYTNIGLETPCYSTPATQLVPATTPTISQLVIITDHVFSKKYTIVAPNTVINLPNGAIAGIVINVVLFIGIMILIIWCRKHRAKKAAARAAALNTTYPPVEPTLPPSEVKSGPQELASPELTRVNSPQSKPWPFTTSSPPAYEGDSSYHPRAKNHIVQELPGDLYINEYHPALSENEAATTKTLTSPSRVSTRSPVASITASSAVSSALVPQESRMTSPVGFVSPLGSPGLNRKRKE